MGLFYCMACLPKGRHSPVTPVQSLRSLQGRHSPVTPVQSLRSLQGRHLPVPLYSPSLLTGQALTPRTVASSLRGRQLLLYQLLLTAHYFLILNLSIVFPVAVRHTFDYLHRPLLSRSPPDVLRRDQVQRLLLSVPARRFLSS